MTHSRLRLSVLSAAIVAHDTARLASLGDGASRVPGYPTTLTPAQAREVEAILEAGWTNADFNFVTRHVRDALALAGWYANKKESQPKLATEDFDNLWIVERAASKSLAVRKKEQKKKL
ncbi:MAG: hypothetical protein CYPHOPRED_004046, partial [Cyphobasidiales sp. Tagirdzhanova-0007]